MTARKKRKATRPQGRPTKLNDSLTLKVCEIISEGNYIETAAACAGISKQTLYNWLKKGARDKILKRNNVHTRFLDAIKTALAESEAGDVRLISAAAKAGFWQAAAWKLERRNPSRWGRADRPPESIGEEEEAIPDEFM